MQVVGGLAFPYVSVATGISYMLGRALYSFGYIHRGPKGRMLGSLISDISLVVLTGTAIATGLFMTQGRFRLTAQ